jgi:cytochrome c oxidase subunit 2
VAGLILFRGTLIFVLIFYFAIKYRRRSEDEVPVQIEGNLPLEVTWTAIPAAICAVMFVWASTLFVRYSRPPKASREVFVIGQQWMWKTQHPEGVQEIDSLHVPVGEPVKLTMTSQDVIHDFSIPAFRLKKDVLPGRYTSEWFKATRTGRFHLFCDQYCGTNHSEMKGWVYVMSPTDYAAWLASNMRSESMAQQGARLFTELGCDSCHVGAPSTTAPSLAGIYGKPQKMANGNTRVIDDSFIRQAILTPSTMWPAIHTRCQPSQDK